jgi:uncharacterized protein YjiS (DUF1127 family)
MSYSTHSDRDFAGAPIWHVLLAAMREMARRSAQRRAYHSTVRELSALSDSGLADAGIHRGDIRDLARRLAYAD